MLSQDKAKSILDKVMDISTADETVARVGSRRSSLTRFAENHIHQNVSEDNAHLSVTAVLGKRMGDASTNKLDDESIKKTVANAIEIAKLAPQDDELMPGLGPQVYSKVQAYDASVDELAPMDRARSVAEAIKLCEENGLRAAGAFSDGSGSNAMANSNGLFAFHKSSGVNLVQPRRVTIVPAGLVDHPI